MKLKIYDFNQSKLLKKFPYIITLGMIISVSIVLISYRDGPAFNGQHVTGAPFDNNQYCNNCHGGGNFGANFSARLFRADSTVVTAYTPNQNYYFVIIYTEATPAPLHGFQTTSATTATGTNEGTNINGWRNNLPAGTANRLVLGHNYVEHTAPFPGDTVIIPWKAPAAGTGSITFYTACNFVNGNNTPRGDQPLRKTYVVTEAAAAFATTASGVDKFASRVTVDLKPDLVVYQHSGMMYMRYNNTGDNQKALITVNDIQGHPIYTGKVSMNKGNNIFPLQTNSRKGVVVATVIGDDGFKISKKIVLE